MNVMPDYRLPQKRRQPLAQAMTNVCRQTEQTHKQCISNFRLITLWLLIITYYRYCYNSSTHSWPAERHAHKEKPTVSAILLNFSLFCYASDIDSNRITHMPIFTIQIISMAIIMIMCGILFSVPRYHTTHHRVAHDQFTHATWIPVALFFFALYFSAFKHCYWSLKNMPYRQRYTHFIRLLDRCHCRTCSVIRMCVNGNRIIVHVYKYEMVLNVTANGLFSHCKM